MDLHYNKQQMFGNKSLEILEQDDYTINKPTEIKYREPSKVDTDAPTDQGIIGFMGDDEDIEQAQYNVMSLLTDELDKIGDKIDKINSDIETMEANKDELNELKAEYDDLDKELEVEESLIEAELSGGEINPCKAFSRANVPKHKHCTNIYYGDNYSSNITNDNEVLQDHSCSFVQELNESVGEDLGRPTPHYCYKDGKDYKQFCGTIYKKNPGFGVPSPSPRCIYSGGGDGGVWYDDCSKLPNKVCRSSPGKEYTNCKIDGEGKCVTDCTKFNEEICGSEVINSTCEWSGIECVSRENIGSPPSVDNSAKKINKYCNMFESKDACPIKDKICFWNQHYLSIGAEDSTYSEGALCMSTKCSKGEIKYFENSNEKCEDIDSQDCCNQIKAADETQICQFKEACEVTPEALKFHGHTGNPFQAIFFAIMIVLTLALSWLASSKLDFSFIQWGPPCLSVVALFIINFVGLYVKNINTLRENIDGYDWGYKVIQVIVVLFSFVFPGVSEVLKTDRVFYISFILFYIIVALYACISLGSRVYYGFTEINQRGIVIDPECGAADEYQYSSPIDRMCKDKLTHLDTSSVSYSDQQDICEKDMGSSSIKNYCSYRGWAPERFTGWILLIAPLIFLILTRGSDNPHAIPLGIGIIIYQLLYTLMAGIYGREKLCKTKYKKHADLCDSVTPPIDPDCENLKMSDMDDNSMNVCYSVLEYNRWFPVEWDLGFGPSTWTFSLLICCVMVGLMALPEYSVTARNSVIEGVGKLSEKINTIQAERSDVGKNYLSNTGQKARNLVAGGATAVAQKLAGA